MRQLIILFSGFLLLPLSSLHAQINVQAEFQFFQDRLDEATTAAGVAAFSVAETDQIKANILNRLDTAFSGFDINFNEAAGIVAVTSAVRAGDEGLRFSLTSSTVSGPDSPIPGLPLLGTSAQGIDFLNRNTGASDVFTANFSSLLDVGDARADQIAEISAGLSSTAAHELGHGLGLQHRDSFGIASLQATNSQGGYQSALGQRVHYLANTFTGRTEEFRESASTFSDLSKVKLQFAQGLTANPIAVTPESGNQMTIADAQPIGLSALSTGLEYDQTAVVEGTFAGLAEYFSIDLQAGDTVLLELLSEAHLTNSFDSVLRLFDTDGSTLLFENDNVQFNIDGVNLGSTIEDTTDSLLWNLPITQSGRYFIELDSAVAGDQGDYHLLVAVNQAAAVPEPGGMLVLIAASTALAIRRRRAGKQTC